MEKVLKLYSFVDGVNDTPFPNKDEQVIIADFRCDYKRMGAAPTITCSIQHYLCLDNLWSYHVYAQFNGERFFIKQIPSSSFDNTDARYKHDVELVSERVILDNVYFYDVVTQDYEHDKPVSNSSNVVFFGTIHEFAERLNHSLNYSGLDYSVVVDEGITSEGKLMSFQDQFFSNVLQEIYNTYDIPYYFVGKVIHIGYTDNVIAHTFKYGSDASLLSIQKQNANYKIVNRVTGVGSPDNIPYYYPNLDEKGETIVLYNNSENKANVVDENKYKKVKLNDKFVYKEFKEDDYSFSPSIKYQEIEHQHIDEDSNIWVIEFPCTFSVSKTRDTLFSVSTLNDKTNDVTIELYKSNGDFVGMFKSGGIKQMLPSGEYKIVIVWNLTSMIAITPIEAEELVRYSFSIQLTQLGISEFAWVSNNHRVNLLDYGIELNVTPKANDEIIIKQLSYIKPSTFIMPSIYRDSLAKERFYNALNGKYINPENNEYYYFNNPYIDGKPKEHIVNFEDIKPSIVGMTNASGQRIDMFIEFAFDENDNDEFDDEGNYLHPYFFGKLRKFDGEHGFNLFDHAIDEGEMTIAMTSGSCGGCEFIIGVDGETQKNPVQVDADGNLLRDANGNVITNGSFLERQNDTSKYEVWVALKKEESTFGVIMPNAEHKYKPNIGDTFVILHIDLPQSYILAAEKKLEQSLIQYMKENNDEKFNFSIAFSRIFFAENPNILAHLDENARIKIEYDNATYELYISSYSYAMSHDNILPEIRVELTDVLTISQNAIQTAINDVKKDILSNIGNSTNGVSQQHLKSFIRKDKDDSTQHNLGVGKDLTVGGNVSVNGDGSFGGSATIRGKASVGNSLSVGDGITLGGDIVNEEYISGTGGNGYAIHKNEDGEYEIEADHLIARILGNVYDLLVKNHATFVGDLTSEEFISGFVSGKGWSIRMKEFINASGIAEKKSVAEFDDLIVRGSMRIYEFIVSQLLGENDNRIFTGMMEVDHYDAVSGKVYLKTDGGRLYNPFRVDDVIIVQQYGGNPNQDNGYYVTKQYEFIVTGTGVGEAGEDRLDWVTFRNFTTSIEGGNESLIAERDTLVRIDNISDTNRKGIIQLMSVGEDTPYMDFIYGAKTDPENSLKGRFGNLGGVYNPLFGWLKEFGAYLTNLYAVGEFVIAHTGENVSDSISIAKGQFRTNYRQTTYDMTEEDNFFTNATMTDNCKHWTLGSDIAEYFLVDELPQFFNYDLYASEQTYAGISEWKGRDMLRLNQSSIMQTNELIDKAGTHKVYTGYTENADGSYTDTYEEEPDTLYLSMRFFVAVSGKVEFGFVGSDGKFINNDFHYTSDVTAREDGYEVKLSGTWNGIGDFCIISTGDVYIDILSLTDRPLDNFMITTSTAIEQDATRISLLGKKVNGVQKSVTDLGIELNAAEERITAYVDKEIQGVESSVSALEIGVGEIRTTVSSVKGTADDAKNLANAAQSAADDAASKAIAAQTTANSANSKADANATAISQNSQSISAIATAFTKDANGNYILTSAAGAVITSEVAKLYAKQADVNALGQRVSTAESNITTTANNLTAFTQKVKFDNAGKNITNIDKSGLVLESGFASLFTTQVNAQGVAKTAEIKTYVDNQISGIKISADQIDITSDGFISIINGGTTTISASRLNINGAFSANNTFKIDTSGYMTCIGGSIGGFTIQEDRLTVTSEFEQNIFQNPQYTTTVKGDGVTTVIGSNSVVSTFGVSMFEDVDQNYLTALSIVNNQSAGVARYDKVCAMRAKLTSNDYGLFIDGGATHILSSTVTKIYGLALKHSSAYGTPSSNMDVILMTGNLSLPQPSTVPGKLYFIKCDTSYTLTVPKCVVTDKAYSATPENKTFSDNKTRIFISSGSVWYEFYASV